MTTPNDRSNDVQAATDPTAAAKQDQIKADHDRLAESARRVEASVPAGVRDTPVQPAHATSATEDTAQSLRNVDAARDNADAARESARRVEQSVPEGTTDRDRR
jgi:hypothetical protein